MKAHLMTCAPSLPFPLQQFTSPPFIVATGTIAFTFGGRSVQSASPSALPSLARRCAQREHEHTIFRMHMHTHMVPDLPFAQGLSPVPCSIARGRHSTCTNLATSMRSIERAVPQAASFRKQAMRRGTSRRRRMTRMGFPARRTLTLASNPWRTQSSRRRPPLRHR